MKPLFQIQRGQMSYYAKKAQIKYGELVGVDSSLSQFLFILTKIHFLRQMFFKYCYHL